MSAVVLGGWLAPVTSANAATDTFSISGDAAGPLTPGTTQLLDLRLDNLVNRTLNLQSLQVSITGVQTLQGGICTAADFQVQQAVLGVVTLPAGLDTLLSSLGLGILQLPRITMLDTAVNQDACKNARVTLEYLGTALDPNGQPSQGHGSNGHGDNDGDVDGSHSGLPGTGANSNTWWLGLAGLGLAAAGATTVRIVRREKGNRS
ncbi:MAG TPA: LPXTG cell wall anchor domain-containing protein [Sporichthyaceae bacterium]|nr:LPXTG cell wall anchor domain-containing protein [Sporichthyaceae bacterium]